MMPRLPGLRGTRGFTLIEVLLAFVIFAVSFAVVLEIVAGSMRSSVRARDYSEAALLAQSVMESVGSELPLAVGSYQGEGNGGLQWTLEISDYAGIGDDDRTLELLEASQTRLFWLDLTLTWGDGRRQREAVFSTIRGRVERS